MMLTTCMLSSEPTHNLWVNKVMKNILKHEELDLNTFNFIVVFWQRWPKLITHELIAKILAKEGFAGFMVDFKKSAYMPFLCIFTCYF